MHPTRFEAVVDVDGKPFRFVCQTFLTTRPEDRLLEHEFYEEFGSHGVPQGNHHEMEVIEPSEKPPGLAVHIHINPHTGRHFVCWANPLPTEADAWKIFITWCVGTAYTLAHGEDFLPLMRRYGNEFLPSMQRDFKITCASSSKIH